MQHCGKKTETTTTRRTRVNTTGSKQKRVSVVVPLSGEAKKWNNKKEEKENGGVDKTYRPARLALFFSSKTVSLKRCLLSRSSRRKIYLNALRKS